MTQANAIAATDKPPAEMFLVQLAFGALLSQALYVAAKLGIADLLTNKPQNITELAKATGKDERTLYRVLRSLASIGVFQESDSKIFALTPFAEPLRSDVPNSMRSGIIFMGEEWHWRVWGNMIQSLDKGEPAWEKVHNLEVFDYFQAHPEHYEIFNKAMTDMTASTAPAVVAAYDFSQFDTIADIAGGRGLLLAQILKANPNLRGVLFDLQPVIQGADPLLEREGVASRVEKVSGNFFESVPANADCYLLKHIIHDWDDECAIQILSNIARMLKTPSKVLIIESVVPEGNEPHFSKLMDLEMLVSPGGVERTATEYRGLLAKAGLRLASIVPTQSAYSIIEAVKG